MTIKNLAVPGMRIACLLLTLFFAACTKEKTNDRQTTEIPEKEDCHCSAEGANRPGEIVTFINQQTGKEFMLKKAGNDYIMGGDMLLTPGQLEILKGTRQQKLEPDGRTFRGEFTKLWPNRTVFYTINSNAPDPWSIQDAIDHWETNTNITFVQRTNQPNYIEFVDGINCESHIGMIGGRQEIRLAWTCGTGNIIHEIGHALGFFHEQMRDDRGNWINVLTANIDPDALINFQTYSELNLPGAEFGNFDFGSIMMYGSWDFSINGQPTITRLDGSTFNSQRIGLSAGDIETYNYLYNPPYMRVTYEETYNNSDPQSGIYDYGWNYRIRFYQDAALTTPYALQYPIVMLQYEWQEDLNGTTGGTQKVVLPVGTSQFVLGPSHYTEQNDFGTVVYKSSYRIGAATFPGYIIIND